MNIWSQFAKIVFNVYKSIQKQCARSKFWGVSGSEDRGGGDNSIQVINFGRVGDKIFKEWRQKIGCGRVGDNSILTFCPTVLDKKCHFPVYF